MILFSWMPIMYEGVSGVASSRVWAACTPCNVGYIISRPDNCHIPCCADRLFQITLP
jgi:hypothetical protein